MPQPLSGGWSDVSNVSSCTCSVIILGTLCHILDTWMAYQFTRQKCGPLTIKADLAHCLMVIVCNLSQILLPEPGDEDVHGHEVELAWLDAQAQACLHRPGTGRLQAALA